MSSCRIRGKRGIWGRRGIKGGDGFRVRRKKFITDVKKKSDPSLRLSPNQFWFPDFSYYSLLI